MIGQGHRGGRVRRSGTLVEEPIAARSIQVDFGQGAEPAASIPWGDLETAAHTTGIENIETYLAFGRGASYVLRAAGRLALLLGVPPIRAALQAAAGRISGPDEAAQTSGYGLLWGEVWDGAGTAVAARMRTPEPYLFTSKSALYLAQRALAGDAPPGFQTPAGAYGPDAVLEIPGVSREDV